MRIRTKPWARPELNACNYFSKNPQENKGKWSEIFGNEREIHLDLGCGKCEFMANLSIDNLDTNYICVDKSLDILGVARRNISAKFEESAVENVILTAYDIEKINDLISKEDKVNRIYINFCNPWSNAGHHKRRLTHTRQLEKYKEFLCEDGEIWFKTDDYNLYLSSKYYFEQSGFEIFFDTQDLNSLPNTGNVMSEHEKMFEKQGITTKSIRAKLIK